MHRTSVLLTTLIVLASPVVAASTVSAGTSDSTSLDDGTIIEGSDVVNIWQDSVLGFRVQTDNAAESVVNPFIDLKFKNRQGSTSLGKDKTAVFNPSDTIDIEYDAVDALQGEKVQVVAVRAEPTDGNAPNTFADALDELTGENANENASYYFVNEQATLNSDSDPTEFSFNPQEDGAGAGHYAFFIAANQPPDGISIDNDQNISISDDITIIGGDATTVQQGSADVTLETSNPQPEDTLNFDVDASNVLSESGVTHAIAVYDRDVLRNSKHTIVVDEDELDKNFNITKNSEFEHSIEEVDGTATVEDGASVNGIELSDGTVSRAVSAGAIVDFIGEDLNGNVPPTSATDDTVLNASLDADVDESGDHTLTIETNDDWQTGTYEFVYMSAIEDAKSSVSTQTGTLTIGGDGDDGDGDDYTGNGGGGPTEQEEEEEEEEQEQEDQQEEQQEETPTVEQVREVLDQTEPSTETQTEIVDNDPDSPGTNINPEGTESVEQITIDNQEATGSIDIREWQDPPEQVAQSIAGTIQNNEEVTEEVAEEVDLDEQVSLDEGDTGDGDTSDGDTSDGDTGDGDTGDGDTGDGDTEVTAQVVTAADIDPAFDEAESSSASVTMTANREDLEDPQEAVIVHETEDSWEVLETTVEERGEEEIVLSGDVESFSLFAVAEIEATETESTGDGTAETDDGTETDSGGSGLIIVGLLAVVAVAGAALYARSNDML